MNHGLAKSLFLGTTPLLIILILTNILLHQKLSEYEHEDPQQFGPAAAVRAFDVHSTHAAAADNNGGKTTPRSYSAKKRNEDDDKEEGLSACLLVNDENPRLPEWIAYHYHILPLRHLIVAVDPASRSSPSEVLNRWRSNNGNGSSSSKTNTGNIDIQIWNDDDYLTGNDRGPCTPAEGVQTCTNRHRTRQRTFILHCMADFKSRNKTWVLLTDVDEYITFNTLRDDDPSMPMEEAPEGVPTIGDWVHHWYPEPGYIDGVISGLPEGSNNKVGHGKHVRNGDFVKTRPFAMDEKEIQMGGIIEDKLGQKYFLRDDIAYRDLTALPHAPPGVPTLNDFFDGEPYMSASIFNDTYDNYADGTWVEIEMNWTYGFETGLKALHGGHIMQDLEGRRYYFEREQVLWPRRLRPAEGLEARRSLPSVADGRKTIMNVLVETERNGLPLGACLSMPRLFYGSKEKEETYTAKLSRLFHGSNEEAVPVGFTAKDFVTLRYQYHAMKGTYDNNLFGKTIIDVSRVSMEALRNEEGALNVHRPLTYYCAKHAPQYATSLLRVNHYLDTWEAFTYRNDARSNKRQCKKCYEEKGNGADFAMDNDIQPWFKHFVQSLGKERAMMLLKNAGKFAKLGNVTLWQKIQKMLPPNKLKYCDR